MKQAGNTFRSICERLKSVWTTWGPMQPKLLLFLFVFWDAGSKFHHIGLAGNADAGFEPPARSRASHGKRAAGMLTNALGSTDHLLPRPLLR